MPSDPERKVEEESYLDLPEGGGAEELESEVQRAREELDELRRRQEHIEKEKQRLEDLSKRQEELERGRADLVEKLRRAVAAIHRESEECSRRLEQLQIIGRNFQEHLRVLEAIHPRQWSASEAPKELSKGMAALEEARLEFAKGQARIAVEAPESQAAAEILEYEQEAEKSFGYWLRSGLAFTLPLQILAVLGILLWLWTLLSPR